MSTGQGAMAVIYSLEGNRWSGVALASGCAPQTLSIYGLSGSRQADEHQPYTPVGVRHLFANFINDKLVHRFLSTWSELLAV